MLRARARVAAAVWLPRADATLISPPSMCHDHVGRRFCGLDWKRSLLLLHLDDSLRAVLLFLRFGVAKGWEIGRRFGVTSGRQGRGWWGEAMVREVVDGVRGKQALPRLALCIAHFWHRFFATSAGVKDRDKFCAWHVTLGRHAPHTDVPPRLHGHPHRRWAAGAAVGARRQRYFLKHRLATFRAYRV